VTDVSPAEKMLAVKTARRALFAGQLEPGEQIIWDVTAMSL
jgi:hypothetical protein